MSELPDRFGGFRLNLENGDHLAIAEWLVSLPRGKFSEEVVKAIVGMIHGVTITFDMESEKDQIVVEALRKVPARKRADYIKDLLFERLTGLDARTNEPIPGQVTIVEKPVVVVQEKVRVVEIPTYSEGMPAPQPPQVSDDSADQSAYNDLNKIDW